MLFPTSSFAFFFFLVLGAYWLLKNNRFHQKLLLNVAGFFYYGLFDPRFLVLLFASIMVSYAFGIKIFQEEVNQKRRKFWLVLSVIANISFLGFFKYYDFFRSSLEDFATLLGLQAHLPILSIVLPLGVSFYTFQNIAYLVELYKKNTYPARTLLDYTLYISFFPQLIMGPIVRPAQFLPQLDAKAPERIPELSRGVVLIFSGYIKKVFLASYLSIYIVEDAFTAPENYSSFELLIASYAYSVQVFCDFSGYIDMGRGLALLLGFTLPDNFNNPYSAANIGEFWRRWHITFSSWLRDYLYFPLGGSKVRKSRTYFNMFFTFLVGGLWHGAHWKFVIWGALHGAALALYKASLDLRRSFGINTAKDRKRPFGYLFAGWFLTFHFCALARIFFNSPDLNSALDFFDRLFEFTVAKRGIHPAVFALIAAGLLLNFIGDHIQKTFIFLHEKLHWVLRPAVWTATSLVLLAVHPGPMAPFIYFQF